MLLIVLVAAGNFVLGFGLAVHLGRGPVWAETLLSSRLRQSDPRTPAGSGEPHVNGH
jgi:hypothetical protein